MRSLVSGVSRGTESLVFRGGVPQSQYDAMRAPFQEGELPGPREVRLPQRRGRRGRSRRPASAAPCSASTPTRPRTSCRPRRSSSSRTACPPRRAVLAGTVETAVNALWDARPLVGDRVAVVGAGMVGCCTARLLARYPRCRGDPGRLRSRSARTPRRHWASASPCPVTRPATSTWSCTPAAPAPGSSCALDLLGADGVVTDLSLVRRHPGRARPGQPLPLGTARRCRPARSGRSPPPAGRGGPVPTGCAWPCACSPTPPSTRC